MAIRLDKGIVRGEIDNTERGRVRGRLWLHGRDEPLELDLEGDAWRDIAGSRLTFANPNPRPQKDAPLLDQQQLGTVGDITASKKVKHITVKDDEWNRLIEERKPIPFEWRNALYLEWFSEANGRVVIESAEYEININELSWQMDEDEDQAQQLMNQHAMRNWLATIIQRSETIDEMDHDDEAPMTEASWEESLQQSDRLNDAHMEALDKYGEAERDDSRLAFVMGWDHLLDAMARQDERKEKTSHFEPEAEETEHAGEEWKAESDDDNDDDFDFEDVYMEEEEESATIEEASPTGRRSQAHPLMKKARQLVLRILKDLRDERRDEIRQDEDSNPTPLDRFIANTMSISGKLAGALATGYGSPREAGYTLAILKRCLNWSNEALAGLHDLLQDPNWEDRHPLFSEYHRELHSIREGITDLRREIREANPGV